MTLWITWKRHRARMLSKYSPHTVYGYACGGIIVGKFLRGKEVT